MCLPSDALWQHLPSYLGFSNLGHGISLHGCSSKVQPLLLTMNDRYLLTTAPPDLERGVAPLSPPAPAQPPLLGHGVAPLGSHVWLFATPWTIAYQAPPSIGFSRQEYWSGLPFPSPGEIFLTQVSNLGLLHCRHMLCHLSHQRRPKLSVAIAKV